MSSPSPSESPGGGVPTHRAEPGTLGQSLGAPWVQDASPRPTSAHLQCSRYWAAPSMTLGQMRLGFPVVTELTVILYVCFQEVDKQSVLYGVVSSLTRVETTKSVLLLRLVVSARSMPASAISLKPFKDPSRVVNIIPRHRRGRRCSERLGACRR